MANLLSSTTVGGNAVITTDNIGTYAITSLSGYATQSYVNTQVSNLVDSAPGALNTLNVLAAALGDDANFSTTVTNSIATKLSLAGGTVSGTVDFHASDTTTFLKSGNSSATGIPDQFYIKHNYGDVQIGNLRGNIQVANGALKVGANLVWDQGDFTSSDISNWNTAYSWGNHASAGYLTSSSTQSKYLRSDVADTATGLLTLSGGVGGNNSLMHSFFLPQNPEGSHVKAPWFFNDMAYARLRGATVTVTVNGGSSPSNSNIDAMLMHRQD